MAAPYSRATRKVGAVSKSDNKQVAIRSHILEQLMVGAIALSCFGGSTVSAESGDFAASCQEISVRNSSLAAQCRRVDGTWLWNTLELTDYVANDDGALVRRDDGSFDASCERIRVSQDGVLSARCRTRDGQWRRTWIDLNEFIANYDGELNVL
jgi:hypothetical protein